MGYMDFMPKVQVGDDYVYVCQARGCTRFMVPWMPEAYTPEEQDRWLIAPHRHNGMLIVRCPQHISHDILKSTIGATKQNIRWMKRSQVDDLPTDRAWSPITPYPLNPRLLWTDDGHLSVRFTGRSNMAVRKARRIAS